MEARTENMSYIIPIKHANLQLLSPSTGCLGKIQQFYLALGPLADAFMTLPDHRGCKGEVETAQMGLPEL